MRMTKDQLFMNIAILLSKRSTCIRRQVGCVIVDNRGHEIGMGYNGVASSMPHCNEEESLSFLSREERDKEYDRMQEAGKSPVCSDYERFPHFLLTFNPNACDGTDKPMGLDNCEAVHAEQNALIKCKDVQSIHTVYVTTFPCISCMKLLINTPVSRLIYLYDHNNITRPMELWAMVKGEKDGVFQMDTRNILP